MFVASHLVLSSTPGLYGLNDFKLEFPIQAQRQRNLTCHKRSRPPIHIVGIESSMLHDKFHYHTILGCDVTDFIWEWRSFCDVPGLLLQSNALYP